MGGVQFLIPLSCNPYTLRDSDYHLLIYFRLHKRSDFSFNYNTAHKRPVSSMGISFLCPVGIIWDDLTTLKDEHIQVLLVISIWHDTFTTMTHVRWMAFDTLDMYSTHKGIGRSLGFQNGHYALMLSFFTYILFVDKRMLYLNANPIKIKAKKGNYKVKEAALIKGKYIPSSSFTDQGTEKEKNVLKK